MEGKTNPRSAPCKGCEERKHGCHGKCEKYQAYRALKDEINAARRIAASGQYCPLDKLPKRERARVLTNRCGRF